MECNQMKFRTAIILSAMAAPTFLTGTAAYAQSTTITPTYNGGYRTTDDRGNSPTTTPTHNGGYRTTDDRGNSVTSTPTYDGGARCN